MRHTLLLLITTAVLAFGSRSQSINGIGYWGYGGITNVGFNPAVAGGRYLVDVNIGSLAQQHQTDALSFNQFDKYFYNLNEYYDFRNRFSGRNLDEIPLLGSFSENQRLLLPGSFLLTIGNRRKNNSAVAFSYELRQHSNFRNLPIDFIKSYLRYPDPTLYAVNAPDAALNIVSWKSFNLTYSRVLLDEQNHLVTAGLTFKLLKGIRAAHFFASDLNVSKVADTLSVVAWSNANYYYTEDIGQGNDVSTGFTGDQPMGIGGDIGFVYEFRPDYDEHRYEMNNTRFTDHVALPYLCAVGLSITDLGSLKFNNSGVGKIGGFQKSLTDFTLFDDAGNFSDTLKLNAKTENVSDFSYTIPARLNAFADVNIFKGAGLNLAYSMPLMQGSENEPFINSSYLLTVTPKFEHKHFGAYIPLSLPENQDFQYGLCLRAGPVHFGTNDLGSLITASTDSRSTGNWYFGIRVPILNKKHKDTDHDYFSDDLDLCPELAGVKSGSGCPDKDGDSVQDKDDLCIDVAGLVALNGCPDRDGDGIRDSDDLCPDAIGPAEGTPKCGCPDEDKDGFIDSNGEDKCPGIFGERDGCPDRDGDGVYDADDKCPDEPGKGFVSKSKEPFITSGCPDDDGDGLATFEDSCPDLKGPEDNTGCPFQDYDNDGVYDYEDSCETIFGEKALKGCPPKKVININVLQNIFYFEEGDSLSVEQETKFAELIPLLMEHVSENGAIILEGHADVTEPADQRKTISFSRAEKIKTILVSMGIPEKNLVVKGKSDQVPTMKRAFPVGKYINRRVEVKLDVPPTN